MTSNLADKITCDVMISYNSKDLDFAKKLADKFTEQGWKVWYADPKMDARVVLNQKGEAILSCKIFVMLITESSAQDSQCQDELALAYISNSSVFPVSMKRYRHISPHLNGGMKLMLAKINWTFFVKKEQYESSMVALLEAMRQDFAQNAPDMTNVTEDGRVQFHGMNINVNFINENQAEELEERELEEEENEEAVSEDSVKKKHFERSLTSSKMSYDFWDRNFENKTEVTWNEFRKKFENDYKEKAVKQFSEDKFKYFVNIIYKDIFTLNKTIKKTAYDQFCEGNPDADPHRFYSRLQQYAVGYFAMREVFNMESSLRLTTIQKLGNFSFPAVISGLTSMLKDEDPNIRAVATIALAKSGKAQKSTVDKIIAKLEDEDRLVRESACLALGYLKAGSKSEKAVADRWRNDPIKSVREAAEISLRRMGGDLAQKCIHVTSVLSSEMDALRTPANF